mmetsp:Transcript_134492/g.335512  ORF Transcript_134492/g.335512 Transcript_134492/m.335512 type:complete len:475 (+) Transcript_134492:484-1908(+)
MLVRELGIVRVHLLLFCILDEELKHADRIRTSALLLPNVGVLPSCGGRRPLFAITANLQKLCLLHLHGDLGIVCVKNLHSPCKESLCLNKVLNVLLVLNIGFGSVCCFGLLARDALSQVTFFLVDICNQTGLWVVDAVVVLVNQARESRDGFLGRCNGSIRICALLVAPCLLVLVSFALLIDHLDHFLNLLKNSSERVISLQHGHNAAEEGGALATNLLRCPLQEGLCFLPCYCLSCCLCKQSLVAGNGCDEARRAVPPDLEKRRDCLSGGSGLCGAKGSECCIAVDDGQGLCKGRFLLCSQRDAFVILLLLRSAHVEKSCKELLCVCFQRLCIRELGALGRQILIVSSEQRLLLIVCGVHILPSFQHGCHILLMCIHSRSLHCPSILQVGHKGVTHVLENADDLTGLRTVDSSERRLEEGLDRVLLLRGSESRGCEEGLLHGRLQRCQAHPSTTSHKFRVVSCRAHCLVRTDC